MRWPNDLADWPMAEHSRRVLCRPHRWHIQDAGSEGPCILLLHGAGGATQSWRGLFPRLARTARPIALDLPGQGFSQSGARAHLTLEHMAGDIMDLMAQEGLRPDAIVGHSAGAAIALEIARHHPIPVVGINAALGNFPGLAGWLFPAMAKLLAMTPFTADLFSASAAAPGRVDRLIAGTGSRLDARGIDLYSRLIRDAAHVDGTLAMMAGWRLDPLLAALPRLAAPVLFIVGEDDRTVPPRVSAEMAEAMPRAALSRLSGLGHLAHEEDPDAVLEAMAPFLADAGVVI